MNDRRPAILVVADDGHLLLKLARIVNDTMPTMTVCVGCCEADVLNGIKEYHIQGLISTTTTIDMTGVMIAQMLRHTGVTVPVILVHRSLTASICDAAQLAGCTAVATIDGLAAALQSTSFIAHNLDTSLLSRTVAV